MRAGGNGKGGVVGQQKPGSGKAEPVIDGVLNNEIVTDIKDLGSDIFRELIGMYLAESPGRLAKIKQRIAAGDADGAADAAHSLKGSSASFGAARLAGLSEKIERAGNAGDLGAAEAVVGELEAEFKKVRDALAAEAGLDLQDR